MKSLFCVALFGIVALVTTGYPQQPASVGTAKARFGVTGLHCAGCTTTVENSLRTFKGIRSVKVDWQSKNATVDFDENLISAQEVVQAVVATPHMMNRNMHYGAVLYLSVPGVKDRATGDKASAVLGKVEGVAKVTVFPQQEAVGIEFASRGKVTTRQLIEVLQQNGLKGDQFTVAQ
jgi:copper chaperone CopZ